MSCPVAFRELLKRLMVTGLVVNGYWKVYLRNEIELADVNAQNDRFGLCNKHHELLIFGEDDPLDI